MARKRPYRFIGSGKQQVVQQLSPGAEATSDKNQARCSVRLGTGQEVLAEERHLGDEVEAPLLGKCQIHKTRLQHGCFCKMCNAQSVGIQHWTQTFLLKQPELEKHKGLCLALSMLWCKTRKTDSATVEPSDLFSEQLDIDRHLNDGLARMKLGELQDKVQKNVLTSMTGQYQYYSDGKPDSDVSKPSGQLNTLMAYAARFSAIDDWAKESGLVATDYKVGFPDSMSGKVVRAELSYARHAARIKGIRIGTDNHLWTREIARLVACRTGLFGLICVAGDKDGHALGFMIQHYYDTLFFRLFDPNIGEWVVSTLQGFEKLVADTLKEHYSHFNRHWWVVKLS